MVKVLSADDLAILLELIANEEWDGIRFWGFELLVCIKKAIVHGPGASHSIEPSVSQSAYDYLAAHLLATGRAPKSLAMEPAPPPQAEVLRRKVEILFKHLDDWVAFVPTAAAPYDDVRDVVSRHLENAKRRAELRELMNTISAAKQTGDQAVAAAAVQKLRDMTRPNDGGNRTKR